MKRFLGAAVAVLVLLLAGCGGGTRTVTRTVTAPASAPAAPASSASPCVPGHSFAGCSAKGLPPTPPGVFRLSPIRGTEFPDVSDWQGPITPNGHTAGVNWSAVKTWQLSHGWPAGGVFKLGEYRIDPDAEINSAGLSVRGMWKAAYWFVRNTGCAHEAGLIVSTAKALGVHFVWNDIEVPEAHGYAVCLLAAEHKAGLGAGVYTGPGTWTGDSGVPAATPLWDAAYNFSGPQFGGLWTRHAAAWQFTDGVFAARTFVPGVGFDDVSVDTGGFIKLAQGTAADPLAVMEHTLRRFRIPAPSPTFGAPRVVTAREWNTTHTFRSHGCRLPFRRAVCVSSVDHDRLLEGRIIRVAYSKPKAHRWDDRRGVRRKRIYAQLHQR